MTRICKRQGWILAGLAVCAMLPVLFSQTTATTVPVGFLLELRMDLDGDGQFDDAAQLISGLPSGQAIGDPFRCTTPIPECAAVMRNGHGVMNRALDHVGNFNLRMFHGTSGDGERFYEFATSTHRLDPYKNIYRGTTTINLYASAQAYRSGQPPLSSRMVGVQLDVWEHAN